VIIRISGVDCCRPKILVNDGNLVIRSAESKNVSIQLIGKSRFFVNNVDVLESLHPSNGSSPGGSVNSDMLTNLEAQVARLRGSLRGPNGILNRLERVESGIPANATALAGVTDRSRFNALNRRIVVLEQKVANLTARLMLDHCKSYPCKNGGTCFNMFETFRCECPANWEGPTCELDVNECSLYAGTDLGCQNGATCFNTMGSYS
jgi:cubilin